MKFTIDEWEALPWWQQRVYLEGLEDDARQREREARHGGRGRQPGGQAQAQAQPVDMASRFNVIPAKFG